MTAVMSPDQQRSRYAQAREALWGKPRIINRIVEEKIAAAEEKLATEQYRKAERERREQRQRELSTQSPKDEPSLFDKLLKNGTSGRFCIENTVSYWYLDLNQPAGIKAIRDMREIAVVTLANFPGITMDNIKGKSRQVKIVEARRAVVRAIKSLRPDLSTPQIGRFINREHTSVLNLLGSLTRNRSKAAKDGADGMVCS